MPRLTNRTAALAVTWLGQVVSLLGTGLTTFALGVVVYQETGSATQFSLVALCYLLPPMLLAPLGGVLVDRFDRRDVMLASDLVALLSPASILALLAAGDRGLLAVQPWHYYAPLAIGSATEAFRWPAYMAAASLLVEKKDLGRVSGLIELGGGAAQVAAPALGAAVLAAFGLPRVVWLDLLSFAFAVLSLLIVRFPAAPPSEAGAAGRGTIRGELASGWAWIRARQPLFALLAFVTPFGFLANIVVVLISPMVLSFGDAAMLGRVQSVAGAGMLVGGIVVSVWGGPRRRVDGVIGGALVAGALLAVAGLPPTEPVVAAAAFVFLGALPFVFSCSQAIWQAKTPPDLQGRVFGVKKLASLGAASAAMIAAGPLADHAFEPLLLPGGPLVATVGALIGSGPGRGIGLLFLVLGALTTIGTLVARRTPLVREVEARLPDAAPSPSLEAAS